MPNSTHQNPMHYISGVGTEAKIACGMRLWTGTAYVTRDRQYVRCPACISALKLLPTASVSVERIISVCLHCPCLKASDEMADTWSCLLGTFEVYQPAKYVDTRCPLRQGPLTLRLK